MIDENKIKKLLEEGNQVLDTKYSPGGNIIGAIRVNDIKFTKWQTKVVNYLESNLDSSNYFFGTF